MPTKFNCLRGKKTTRLAQSGGLLTPPSNSLCFPSLSYVLIFGGKYILLSLLDYDLPKG